MDQSKKNIQGLKISELACDESCIKPEEKHQEKKKGETRDGESRKKSNRTKEERLKRINSYLTASEAQESSFSLRLNEFPMRPQCLVSKDQLTSYGRRRKSVLGKTAEIIREEKPEAAEPIVKSEENNNPTEVKASESSFEKVLGLCRMKLELMDNRRNEIIKSMPIMKGGLLKEVMPDNSFNVNMGNSSKMCEKPSGYRLSKKTPPPMDSYFNFVSLQKQQMTTADTQLENEESPKTNINQILKGHAQKVSGHSLKVSSVHNAIEFLNRVKIPRKEVSCKSSSIHSARNFQKVIEIQLREENKGREKSDTVDGRSEGEEKKVEKEEKTEGRKDWAKKEVEKQDANKDVHPTKYVGKVDEDPCKKGGNEMPKKTSTEKVEDLVKRVTYTDRLLLNRFRKDSTEKLKTPRAIIASVIEKLNNPFKDEMQKRLEVCLNYEGANKKSEGTTEPKPAAKTTSDATLKPAVQKQRSAREAIIDDQVNKSVEQLSKAKCARSSELRDIVAQAIKEHKIFCIFDSHWYIVRPVREELLNRGWLEVIPDRRLIPRRRPPPTGPTMDRNASSDYAAEAILAAREAIVDDYTERLPPSKFAAEKPKPQRKASEESLKEAYSEFRIVPPTSEKKKSNQDIRDFVGKCHYLLMRKQNLRLGKDKKGKATQGKGTRSGKVNLEEDMTMPSCPSSSADVEDTIDFVQQNRKFMLHFPGAEQSKEEPRQQVPTEEVTKESKISLSENDAKIASKIIQSSNARIHFMWLSIKPAIHLKCFNYSPEIINKFQRTTFCTKIGLWSHLNNIQWYAHEVTFPAKSPRMYNTGEAEDLQAFFQDFQMTACIGILKWLSETFFDKGIKGVQKKRGKVPIKAFEFAIRQCERYIRFQENEDLNLLEDPKVMQEEWNTFLQWFYIITNDHGKVQETSNAQLTIVYTKAVGVLRAMKRHWPEIDIDGRLNIWIMKPYCASCGRGIFMTNNVYYIGQHSKYIVQKYIERPLLIYNTKFDIRQWFMITKLVPLEVWMYKECYLRFCTQPFVLRNLHESVHLSNNSVQRKYLNQKDSGLPDQNMWDSTTFQQYLKTIGQPNTWNEVIYPGMRDAIISLMLAAQDTFDNQRRSWFEVYGADFMISSNPKDGPWLIEINESPAMDPSTKVTARLCPQMLRDVIKVVVDKRANKNALTGQWELVYRQNYSPSYGTISIDVKGKRIAKAPQNKTGYNNNWAAPPSLFNANRAENTQEREDSKKYEILKSYKPGKGSSEVNLDSNKSGSFKSRVKAKLINDSSVSSFDKLTLSKLSWKLRDEKVLN